VSEGPLLLLVELVRRELGAKNARVELGGDPPDEATALWRELPGGWRVVALFGEPPADREEKLIRLDALISSFSGVAAEASSGSPPMRVPVADALAAALSDLSLRAGGTDAAVLDMKSPMLWGSSDATRTAEEDVDAAVRAAALVERARAAGIDLAPLLSLDPSALGPALAKIDASAGLLADLGRQLRMMIAGRGKAQRRDEAGWRRYLLSSAAIAAARRIATAPAPASAHSGHLRESMHGDAFGLLVRSFAGTYLLAIAFDGPFSELHAEAALLHALPRIERLVLALPPMPSPTGGPPSKEAKVVELHAGRRRRR
jgi:hypothetical protein